MFLTVGWLQCVTLATEPGISLIIVTPMSTLQWNLNRSMFVVWEMKRNVSVVRFKFHFNILISGKIIKEMLGSVASGTQCIFSKQPSQWLGSYKAASSFCEYNKCSVRIIHLRVKFIVAEKQFLQFRGFSKPQQMFYSVTSQVELL